MMTYTFVTVLFQLLFLITDKKQLAQNDLVIDIVERKFESVEAPCAIITSYKSMFMAPQEPTRINFLQPNV